MKVIKVNSCGGCKGRFNIHKPEWAYSYCTKSKTKTGESRKITNISIIPKYCPLEKDKSTKDRLWIVRCCKDCKYVRSNYTSYKMIGKPIIYYCCKDNDNRIKLKDANKLPSWCPLEDYKEVRRW